MGTHDLINAVNNSKHKGLQITKSNGILTSTWLIYAREDFIYFFDISEKVNFDDRHKYTQNEFLDFYKDSDFLIDCEIN